MSFSFGSSEVQDGRLVDHLHLQTILHGAETIIAVSIFFKLSVDPSYQGAHSVVTTISAALLSPTATASLYVLALTAMQSALVTPAINCQRGSVVSYP
jgi:hypothetical protein